MKENSHGGRTNEDTSDDARLHDSLVCEIDVRGVLRVYISETSKGREGDEQTSARNPTTWIQPPMLIAEILFPSVPIPPF